jgi:hypothetical protein
VAAAVAGDAFTTAYMLDPDEEPFRAVRAQLLEIVADRGEAGSACADALMRLVPALLRPGQVSAVAAASMQALAVELVRRGVPAAPLARATPAASAAVEVLRAASTSDPPGPMAAATAAACFAVLELSHAALAPLVSVRWCSVMCAAPKWGGGHRSEAAVRLRPHGPAPPRLHSSPGTRPLPHPQGQPVPAPGAANPMQHAARAALAARIRAAAVQEEFAQSCRDSRSSAAAVAALLQALTEEDVAAALADPAFFGAGLRLDRVWRVVARSNGRWRGRNRGHACDGEPFLDFDALAQSGAAMLLTDAALALLAGDFDCAAFLVLRRSEGGRNSIVAAVPDPHAVGRGGSGGGRPFTISQVTLRDSSIGGGQLFTQIAYTVQDGSRTYECASELVFYALLVRPLNTCNIPSSGAPRCLARSGGRAWTTRGPRTRRRAASWARSPLSEERRRQVDLRAHTRPEGACARCQAAHIAVRLNTREPPPWHFHGTRRAEPRPQAVAGRLAPLAAGALVPRGRVGPRPDAGRRAPLAGRALPCPTPPRPAPPARPDVPLEGLPPLRRALWQVGLGDARVVDEAVHLADGRVERREARRQRGYGALVGEVEAQQGRVRGALQPHRPVLCRQAARR